MKARITGDGCLVIQAENGTEEYALAKWNENFDLDGNGSSALSILPMEEQKCEQGD